MPQTAPGVCVENIKISKDSTPERCEEILLSFANLTGSKITVRLASELGPAFFGDVWASILVGTICRHHYNNAQVIAWGIQDRKPNNKFENSLAGLTALQLTEHVTTDRHQDPMEVDGIERMISDRRRGLLEAVSGHSRTLVEFDPQSPVAGLLQGQSDSDRHNLFKNAILSFRQHLELGYKSRGFKVHSQEAIGDLTTFLSELHDNAFKYSRNVVREDKLLRGLRIVRIRSHIANNRDELIGRAAVSSPVRSYLEQIARGPGIQGIMEASVSDFGTGIVDHFLSSERGFFYRDHDRREILNKLLLEPLSSSSNPSSGFGILKALRAAARMQAFVSLRTNEFWRAQSFSDPQAPMELRDVNQRERARVAGTHWQFLWPMGI